MTSTRGTAPRLVELAGPAGVGKSTIAHALRQRCPAQQATIWGLPMLPLLTNGMSLLPTLAEFWGRSRSLLWDESRHLVRLQTLQRRLANAPYQPAPIILFDEGPIFALAWLRGFGHESLRSPAANAWWQNTLQLWAKMFDVVVVLEASDRLLATRIKASPAWHEIKHASDEEIGIWMDRFRMALEWVLAGLSAAGGPAILRVATDEQPSYCIAELVVSALRLRDTH
jgi:AAA domain